MAKKDISEKGPLAVIKTGGKQYLVSAGDVIKIEKLKEASRVGDAISFDEVLLTDDGSSTKIGAPVLDKAKVEGKVLEIGRSKKVNVIRYKAKSNYFKKKGHRQSFLKVEITKV